MANGVTTETRAFYGEVTEVQLDRVTAWVEIEAAYSLPIAPPWPESQAGTAPPEEQPIPETPGGKVSKTLKTSSQTPRIPPEQAKARLKELGYPQPTEEAFVMAAVQGNAEAVELFLAAGLSPDSQNRRQGMSALLAAATSGHVEAGLMLIAAGADVSASDSNGSTPLIWAAGKCQASKLVQALVDGGADVNAQARGGATPLMMARAMSCSENADILAAAGAR
jgi:hypothetical protein